MLEGIEVQPPSLFKRVLEKLRVREITPEDITKTPIALDELYQKYPSLAGDRTGIGSGDDGHCQDWCDHPG